MFIGQGCAQGAHAGRRCRHGGTRKKGTVVGGAFCIPAGSSDCWPTPLLLCATELLWTAKCLVRLNPPCMSVCPPSLDSDARGLPADRMRLPVSVAPVSSRSSAARSTRLPRPFGASPLAALRSGDPREPGLPDILHSRESPQQLLRGAAPAPARSADPWLSDTSAGPSAEGGALARGRLPPQRDSASRDRTSASRHTRARGGALHRTPPVCAFLLAVPASVPRWACAAAAGRPDGTRVTGAARQAYLGSCPEAARARDRGHRARYPPSSLSLPPAPSCTTLLTGGPFFFSLPRT